MDFLKVINVENAFHISQCTLDKAYELEKKLTDFSVFFLNFINSCTSAIFMKHNNINIQTFTFYSVSSNAYSI